MMTITATLFSAPRGPGATGGWQPGPHQATLPAGTGLILAGAAIGIWPARDD